MLISLRSYDVPRADLGADAQICIRLQLSVAWLPLEALGCVPVTLHVASLAVNVVLWQRVEALAQVLNLAKLVLAHALHVFDLAFHNDSLWESLFVALRLDRLSDTIEELGFTVAELVSFWVDSPRILSLALHACRNRSMSLFVHFLDLGPFLHSATLGVEQVLGIYLPT